MDRFKTILFYALAAGGLILASFWFTQPGDPAHFKLPPTFTPLPTAPPTPTAATPPASAETGCVATPGGYAYGYIPDAPFSVDLAPPGLKGDRLVISGTVYAGDCVTPLPGAIVEVWQTDAEGRYDRTPPYILRGKMRTDAQGRYEFATIKPGHYREAENTPPAHIHYRVSYPQHDPFATMLYFKGDPYLPPSLAGSPLVIPLTKVKGSASPTLRGVFDIVLPIAPPTPTPASTATNEPL